MAQNFELGLIKDQDGDRSSMYSSCGSLSFVITDDADIEKIPEPSMANVDDPEKTSNGNVDKSLNGDVDKSLNGDVDKSSNCDADKTSNEMFSYMTQSQYAQVQKVFINRSSLFICHLVYSFCLLVNSG